MDIGELKKVYDGITNEVQRQQNIKAGKAAVPRQWRRCLTDREIQIVQLMADGRSNQEIGKALYLTENTIKSHLQRIGKVMGTGRREAMVAEAMRAGLVK